MNISILLHFLLHWCSVKNMSLNIILPLCYLALLLLWRKEKISNIFFSRRHILLLYYRMNIKSIPKKNTWLNKSKKLPQLQSPHTYYAYICIAIARTWWLLLQLLLKTLPKKSNTAGLEFPNNITKIIIIFIILFSWFSIVWKKDVRSTTTHAKGENKIRKLFLSLWFLVILIAMRIYE